MTASKTLREISGLGSEPARLADSVLVLVDFQNTYRSGVMELDGAEAAFAAGVELLGRARTAGIPVVHIQHDSGEGSPYDINAEIGRISDEVAPIEGETVVVKNFPNAFVQTELEDVLRKLGAEDLILAGCMTHMCISYTTQEAFNRGFRATVVADATATRSLAAFDGTVVLAADLQKAALTGIGDTFAVVVGTQSEIPA